MTGGYLKESDRGSECDSLGQRLTLSTARVVTPVNSCWLCVFETLPRSVMVS
jgi:hypothetical protein